MNVMDRLDRTNACLKSVPLLLWTRVRCGLLRSKDWPLPILVLLQNNWVQELDYSWMLLDITLLFFQIWTKNIRKILNHGLKEKRVRGRLGVKAWMSKVQNGCLCSDNIFEINLKLLQNEIPENLVTWIILFQAVFIHTIRPMLNSVTMHPLLVTHSRDLVTPPIKFLEKLFLYFSYFWNGSHATSSMVRL